MLAFAHHRLTKNKRFVPYDTLQNYFSFAKTSFICKPLPAILKPASHGK